jgi:hypothetical protein
MSHKETEFQIGISDENAKMLNIVGLVSKGRRGKGDSSFLYGTSSNVAASRKARANQSSSTQEYMKKGCNGR